MSEYGIGPCAGMRCHLGAITGTGCSGNETCPLEQLHAKGVLSLPWNADNFVQKQSDGPEQWTCGTDELLNQCILLHIHASGFRAGCDKESLDHLTDLYTAAGPAFCREALPRLRDASTMDMPF